MTDSNIQSIERGVAAHSTHPKSSFEYRERKSDVDVGSIVEPPAAERFRRLGWKRLTVVLFVECIALGALSLPATFATLGVVLGTILTVFVGVLSVYAGWIIGKVKLAYPETAHYTDVGRLFAGRIGYEIVTFMFLGQLTFAVGSHCLTGSVALSTITGSNVCSVAFSAVSAVVLLLLAIPPSFTEIAILGYIDIMSIMAAILITIVATGVQGGQLPNGELIAVEWSAWPKEGLTFTDTLVALSNLIFAFAYTIGQFSFMDEMHTPQDYMKAIVSLGTIEVVVYVLTGCLIYTFVGNTVESPALLSAGPLFSKITFGVALPVIFISGSICTTIAARSMHSRIHRNSVHRFIGTKKGWLSWFGLITALTIVAWVLAEAIPFFSNLLSISAALFLSGFSLYFPGYMWFALLQKGRWFEKQNIVHALSCAFLIILGFFILGGGVYANIVDIKNKQQSSGFAHSFSCNR